MSGEKGRCRRQVRRKRCLCASDAYWAPPPPPDGLPDDQIPPENRRELQNANKLLGRAVDLAIAAHKSSAKATIIFENPANRSDPRHRGLFDDSFSNHGSIFDTTHFKRLLENVRMSSATFAMCRFGHASQKYSTLYYTNDAASVLDRLNLPDFKCNHGDKHAKVACGRNPDGSWASKDVAAYPDKFHVWLAMALTAARTGSPAPISKAAEELANAPAARERAAAAAAQAVKDASAAGSHDRDGNVGQAAAPIHHRAPAAPPSALASHAHRPDATEAPTPVPFAGFAPALLAPPTTVPAPPSPVAAKPQKRRDAPWKLAGSELVAGPRLAAAAKASNSVRFAPEPVALIEPNADSPPYSGLGGTPNYPHADNDALLLDHVDAGIDVDAMETCVAELVGELATPSPIGDWFDISGDNALCSDHLSLSTCVNGTRRFEHGTTASDAIERALEHHLLRAITSTSHSAQHHREILHALRVDHLSLRADSPDAPSTHKQAEQRGPPWVGPGGAEEKELGNHASNGSWLYETTVPKGRRLHHLIWVYKEKRDGTAKARLCVQGCTMEGNGIDFDQTFSDALKYES